MNEDALFYVGQKAFIKKGNEILVLNDSNGGLHYPGGKIQEGEMDLAESLKREVREETGLKITVGEPFATWTNTFPPQHRFAGKRVFHIAYVCEYVSGDIMLGNEHDKHHWVTKDNYTEVNDGTFYFEILRRYFTR